MPQSNSVALVVDNPKRDLRGVVLTAYQLARKGCSTAIVPMYAQGYDIPLSPPDFVLLNYIRLGNEELARSYRELGIRVAVMDTEGGIFSRKGRAEPSTWATTLKESGLSALVDEYFLWGDAVRQAFLANSGISAEKLHLTGCPRYDLGSPPWNAALAYRRSGFILVNTNFPAINPVFTRSAEEEKRIFRSLGWSDAYLSQWFEQLEHLFPRYLDEVEAMARAMPQQLVIVRPHPFENIEHYRRRFADVPNIEVDGSGDVLNMIHEATCIVHLNCGTAVDGLLQKKVPVSLEYLNTELLLDHTPLPSQLSLKPGSRAEMIETVRGLVEGSVAFDHDAAFAEIEPWFYRADGAAGERVASLLATAAAGQPRSSLSHAIRGGRAVPSAKQVLQGLATVALGSRLVGRLRSKVEAARRGKDIEVSDVQSLLDLYASASQGPRYRARPARNRLTGMALSTIEILPA
ncbi:MAG: surface carbohydrate biosynthesis protein [Shinella sp.]|uniref:surface carbohydrate biosynthesis protein n=1 Tax=Shinella sp. TaxID=1870904 RepID=UPI003C7970B6